MAESENNDLQHRLLVLDDDPTVCKLFSEVGHSQGFNVIGTTTVLAFQDTYKNFKPTLIILDLNLADQDGIEVLRYLATETCKCGIIVMSGHDERVRTTAFRLGQSYGLEMIAHFQKPLNIDAIKILLEKEASRVLLPSQENLSRALKRYDFVLHFQPVVSFKTNTVEGAEALVRWTPPGGKIFFPDLFIPLAEQSGLIKPLTRWVITEAFKQWSLWALEHDFTMSINLSARVLTDLELADEISELAAEYKVVPEKICFEVTETGVMSQPQVAMDILTRLRIKGFMVSLDDFGTGYSSLVELHRMPFSEMKIDKSFVVNMIEDTQSWKIANSIIDLGHSLDLKVVAEGIESQEVFDKLAETQCDIAQGYLISRPVEALIFDNWLKTHCEKKDGKWVLKKPNLPNA